MLSGVRLYMSAAGLVCTEQNCAQDVRIPCIVRTARSVDASTVLPCCRLFACSNPSGEVGFLADVRRMNVAVTRARRHVALVCNSETVGQDPFLGLLIEYVQQHGEYESAAELVET
jgi:hypothetical protein